MKILKIVCHDKEEFFCKTHKEIRVFLSNYKRIKGKEIRKKFPGEIFWVDHIEILEMSEDEYHKIPATTESIKYFAGIDGRT